MSSDDFEDLFCSLSTIDKTSIADAINRMAARVDGCTAPFAVEKLQMVRNGEVEQQDTLAVSSVLAMNAATFHKALKDNNILTANFVNNADGSY